MHVIETPDYWSMHIINDLREYCKERGIRGYSKWNKAKLCQTLANYERVLRVSGREDLARASAFGEG